MAVERRRLDFNREKQILINLILNTEYCNQILPVIKEEFFNAKPSKQIIRWVQNYFDSYNVAPRNQIRTIFEDESEYLDEEDAQQIEAVLQYLSEVSDNEVHNTEYLVDTAFDFFRRRTLELQITAAQHHVQDGDFSRAEEALEERFNGFAQMPIAVRWDDEDYIKECITLITKQDDPDEAFFRYPGRLGDFIGNIHRGWFIAYLGPSKRGKTIYLVETIMAAITRKLNVVFFSLEMPDKQIFGRVMYSATGQKPNGGEVEIMSPIFDCKKNQTDTCDRADRCGVGSLATTDNDGNDVLATYDILPDWEVCTSCRGTKEYEPASWSVPVKKKEYDEGEYFKKVNSVMRLYGRHCRTIFRPSKTATIDDMKQDLYYLEHTENFVPDVIVIDYADLMKPTRATGVKRHDLDDMWEDLRALGQSRKMLIATASQTNRASSNADYIQDTDVAEDYSKIAKLDLAIGLCQNDAMKERGEMNLNKVVFRHGEFIQSRTCMVLQELSYMQGILDSEFQYR